MMETWAEITKRHRREKIDAIKKLRDLGLTQSEAAKLLDVQRTHLNNQVKRNGIYWPGGKQGVRARPLSEIMKIVEDAE